MIERQSINMDGYLSLLSAGSIELCPCQELALVIIIPSRSASRTLEKHITQNYAVVLCSVKLLGGHLHVVALDQARLNGESLSG